MACPQAMTHRLELGVGRRVQLRERAILDSVLYMGRDDC